MEKTGPAPWWPCFSTDQYDLNIAQGPLFSNQPSSLQVLTLPH